MTTPTSDDPAPDEPGQEAGQAAGAPDEPRPEPEQASPEPAAAQPDPGAEPAPTVEQPAAGTEQAVGAPGQTPIPEQPQPAAAEAAPTNAATPGPAAQQPAAGTDAAPTGQPEPTAAAAPAAQQPAAGTDAAPTGQPDAAAEQAPPAAGAAEPVAAQAAPAAAETAAAPPAAAVAAAAGDERDVPAHQRRRVSTRPLRLLALLTLIGGVILTAAGVVTWVVVTDQLSDEKIVVSDDADNFAGEDVDGPFTAYAEADVINEHALEASDGQTYAELEQDDPRRETVMTASFLRASLFTSVVAFGVAAFAAGMGVLMIIVGWALLAVDRALKRNLTPTV
jgi:hypothetical protein